jgi:putative membrane protein
MDEIMAQNSENTAGGGDLIDKAQDAISAVVGLASASTLGSHDTQTYLTSAAISDLYEIEAGRIALRRTACPSVRTFAEMLVEDHRRSAQALASKAKLAGMEPQALLDERRKGMIDNLQAASDGDFDRVFLTQQAAAHQEAVALHQGYAEHGDNEVLRGLASGAAPALEQHLTMARHLGAQH